MLKLILTLIFGLSLLTTYSQVPEKVSDSSSSKVQDSLKKRVFLNHLGNGYFPTKYFNFDLRYLIKYNQYEAFRTGLGGVTNKNFSEKYKLNTYVVYGFRDHRFKYSFGGAVRLNPKNNIWLQASYTDDLQETGSTNFLTDSRLFQFFEPRLLNIELFYKHITQSLAISYNLSDKIKSETQFSVKNIVPTFNYALNLDDKSLTSFDLTLAKFGLEWNLLENGQKLISGTTSRNNRFIISTQITQSIKGVFKNELNFTKLDFKALYNYTHENTANTQLVLTSGIVNGTAPLTNLYHAYPNNNTKETILQRFTVAGITSFETMYFNEFFSDKLTTIHLKHVLRPFKFGKIFNPQLVLISRFAIGSMSDIENHSGHMFNTLEKGYFESGIELNKLILGFGLSAAYRYGSYHLPEFQDNIALKFTFNITL